MPAPFRSWGLVIGLQGLFALGCGPSAQDLELRQMAAAIDELRAQLVRFDGRTEALSNRVILLSDSLEQLQERTAAAGAGSRVDPRGALGPDGAPEQLPNLEVVRLTPEAPPAEELPEEPPIELTLVGEQEPPPVPVTQVPPPPSLQPNDSLFRDALAAFQKGQSAAAYELFASFVAKHPRHPQADSALYWMGECRFERGEFEHAIKAFQRVLNEYPHSTKAPDALLKIGIAYEKLQKPVDARNTYTELVARFPHSAMAELARARIARPQGARRGANREANRGANRGANR